MSRIGRLPITVPSGVDVALDGRVITVKGPKGSLTRQLPPRIDVARDGDTIVVSRPTETKLDKSLHGLTRTLVNNMVVGVTDGYRKGLEIVGVGYRAQKTGEKLVLALGYSHPIEIDPPAGISFEVEKPHPPGGRGHRQGARRPDRAKVRATRKPEPYKGKGVRYAGEKVRRKAGKAGKIGGKK
jgi:large subunit ribosomal protein L6